MTLWKVLVFNTEIEAWSLGALRLAYSGVL